MSQQDRRNPQDHEGQTPILRFHAATPPRGLASVPQSTLFEGRFGRMFRNLPPFAPDDQALSALAATMSEPEPPAGGGAAGGQDVADPLDNPAIPAGFTYLGQFVDHDITFDPASKLQRENDPDALRDFRTPRFDLDSVYGRGPDDQPYLYEDDGIHLRVDINANGEEDLPRTAPKDGALRRALTGDPRNDENAIVSQLHLAFLKFHNAVVDSLAGQFSGDALLDEARRLVRWHYQWAVIHDFLRRIAGDAVVDDVLGEAVFSVGGDGGAAAVVTVPQAKLRFFHWHNQPFMPVEFSVAAYRFGHSMVRPEYELNGQAVDVPIFSSEKPDLRGFRERPPGLTIEWHRFFSFPDQADGLQLARRIDTKLAPGLFALPNPVVAAADPHKSLAERNLLRGKALGLPTGQAVAAAMGLPADLILRGDALGLPADLVATFGESTPLWFYILKEAEVYNEGLRLGPVGGRIVAEVLVGLLAADPASYLSVAPTWTPTLGATQDGTFTMADLLTVARVTIPRDGGG